MQPDFGYFQGNLYDRITTMTTPDNQLEKVRHSLAHLLAAAVLELYPDTKNTIGPAIDNGFYYDFEFSSPIGEADLEKIESKMRDILKTWRGFEEKEVSASEARKIYKDNPYKLELVDEIDGKGEKITLYTSGLFTDLCRGGHVEKIKELEPNAFRLDRIAGAYWRGDEKNKMLTRIYGLAFENKKDLARYLQNREEAEKRDHRKLGKELDLFTFSDLVGPGLPLFTPKGTLLRDLIINKIQGIQSELGYQRVTTPHITKPDLYKTSGHWDKFGDELFNVTGKAGGEFVMKPMNCPHHIQIYASQMRSYKDLPIRYMEAGVVYRDEQAGELLGLGRVRSITVDDGHIFATPEQGVQEVRNVIQVIREFYTALGMWGDEKSYWVSLSVRDPETPEKYFGDDSKWSEAENILEEAAKAEGIEYKRVEGEATFYGPKLDFQFFDALSRERQLATVQVDMILPDRFGLEYTDIDGERKTPIMIHRAIAGSLERFLSIIIEHFAGAFPVWLSPVQVAVLPVSVSQEKYSSDVYTKLKEAGVRVEMYADSDTLGKRIRKAKIQKIPYLVVLGEKEEKENMLTVEQRMGDALKLSVEDLISKIKEVE